VESDAVGAVIVGDELAVLRVGDDRRASWTDAG
jgi:hypothetical protein